MFGEKLHFGKLTNLTKIGSIDEMSSFPRMRRTIKIKLVPKKEKKGFGLKKKIEKKKTGKAYSGKVVLFKRLFQLR